MMDDVIFLVFLCVAFLFAVLVPVVLLGAAYAKQLLERVTAEEVKDE